MLVGLCVVVGWHPEPVHGPNMVLGDTVLATDPYGDPYGDRYGRGGPYAHGGGGRPPPQMMVVV